MHANLAIHIARCRDDENICKVFWSLQMLTWVVTMSWNATPSSGLFHPVGFSIQLRTLGFRDTIEPSLHINLFSVGNIFTLFVCCCRKQEWMGVEMAPGMVCSTSVVGMDMHYSLCSASWSRTLDLSNSPKGITVSFYVYVCIWTGCMTDYSEQSSSWYCWETLWYFVLNQAQYAAFAVWLLYRSSWRYTGVKIQSW